MPESRIWQHSPKLPETSIMLPVFCAYRPFGPTGSQAVGSSFDPGQFLGRLVTCINNAELAITILAATTPGLQPRSFVRGVFTSCFSRPWAHSLEGKKKLHRQGLAPQVESTPITARSYHTGYIPSKGRGMECVLTRAPARRSLRSAGLKSSDQLFSANAMC